VMRSRHRHRLPVAIAKSRGRRAGTS
jgi:hypothetical protein